MNRILPRIRQLLRFFRSRAFAVSVFALAFCFILWLVADQTNHTVFIQDEAARTIAITARRSVGDILEQEGVALTRYDKLSVADFEGNIASVSIERAFPVRVTADGATRTVMVVGGTVKEALAAAGVALGAEDMVSQPLNAFLEQNEEIVVRRVAYTITSYEEAIPFETTYKETSLVANGRQRLLAEGEEGRKILTYEEMTIDGVVQETELLGENIVKKPVDAAYLVGVAGVPVSGYDFGYEIVDNVPVGYRSVLEDYSATGYSAGNGAWGASGNDLFYGHVAVDPAVIPYNTRMYITSPDGSFVYGYAIASDTGSAMIGTNCVDLYYETYYESRLNGRRTVNIYILD